MTDLIHAFKWTSVPSNPIPFLKALENEIKLHGTDFIKTDEGKALLFILMTQSYGQLAVIDIHKEYNRLKERSNYFKS